MRSKLLPLCVAALLTGAGGLAVPDDGAITNKSMTRTIQVPVFDQEIVNNHIPEAEHAFTDMLLFYVPSQAASGLPTPIAYCNIDNEPESGEDCSTPVETLEVAKPLINTFVYGPMFEPEGTAFYHSYADIYGAVSLDDGETWKQTNLSDSARLSSFNLTTDHVPATRNIESIPADHTAILTAEDGTEGYHKPGYFWPYASECTSCHGETLLGGHHAPSCYNCHGSIWFEENPVDYGPTIVKASWSDAAGGVLNASGDDADFQAPVEVINAVTKASLATTTADDDGRWSVVQSLAKAPCSIAAKSNGVEGPAVVPDGTPADCDGAPEDMPILIDYPGGAYNVFTAYAGNKVLAAWPSRFCEQGQPAYSFAYDGDDTIDPTADDADKQQELLDKRNAVADYLGIDVTKDLYLTDLFGVGGAQGSIDFADEGYPQAGIVPFGCVWTARGVLLPGDDPRTTETEASHMVWTKAERLTSGRRDPNRIEVHGVPGAGFVITWQEDPDGLRPGQGEGPGEGWSGAVAHDKTDIWYSFINWEYFDLVEDPDDPTADPVNIVDHPLPGDEEDATGRPQVYVPMAVPMRLSNNDKCNAEYYAPGVTLDLNDPDEAKKYFSYCNGEVAANYGLQDFCADTVLVPVGPLGEDSPICVNADGLPNIANTASTRPRTALQGYSTDDDDAFESAWVMVASEESKGLGRYLFTPDGEACQELDKEDPDYNPDCTADDGKNQWWYSFDMGKPATSQALSTDEDVDQDSLVNNLVSQGNILNQPEVDWRTGVFYPVINTLDMWDFSGSTNGIDYNFNLYNTEIARRSSMLSQGIKKAVGSQSGLTALPSWKQGAMPQGGPADTMFRRIAMDFGAANAETCPIRVKAESPEITSAKYRVVTKDDGTVLHRVAITVEGLDASADTRMYIRNALTNKRIVSLKAEETTYKGGFNVTADTVPCAIQAADQPADPDGKPLYGPYILVANAPANCVGGPVPLACTPDYEPERSWDLSMGNPYAFRNMECENWLVAAGDNPYYPEGLCGDPATNLSGVTADTCIDDQTAEEGCPVLTCTETDGVETCVSDTNPILQGYDPKNEEYVPNTMRALTWHQCPSDATVVANDLEPVDCGDDETNLDDQSWYNPLDVSKGHRGFIDGDFVMFLYAWSPNWRLNAKGNDRYDLYVRRSFDGAQSWTTTPALFTASNGETYEGEGTVTCETYRATDTGVPDAPEPHVCYGFEAGDNEHARNVTQHKRMRITTLDPRFAPSGGPRGSSITDKCLDGLLPDGVESLWTCDDTSDLMDTDARNPSRYGIVFETGDNNTVVDGEAEPEDLFYSRAEQFGDHYVVWAETDTTSADLSLCYPSNAHEDPDIVGSVIENSGFCNEFDRMNTRGDTRSSEADLEMNPGGSKLYGVWAQWVYENDDHTLPITESEGMARRLWWIDDYISTDDTLTWTLPGTNQEETVTP